MRTLLLSGLVAILILVVAIPALLVRDWYGGPAERTEIGSVPSDIYLSVYWVEGNEMLRMGLEEYVAGVVAAEMPARFHPEALKAQSVAARTYAIRRVRALGGQGCKHYPDADICTDPTLGQAWESPEELRDRWGFIGYFLYWRKVQTAVDETRGHILVHNGGPIDAVYHSAAGDRTENSETVWGKEIAYLKSVDSPHEAHSPYWERETELTRQEISDLLRVNFGVSAERGKLVEVLDQSPSGRAVAVRVGQDTFEGRAFREALDLPSTLILDISEEEDGVIITTRGHGHGVGMSQYGADGMAQEGYDYKDILKHYYPGTELRPIFSE